MFGMRITHENVSFLQVAGVWQTSDVVKRRFPFGTFVRKSMIFSENRFPLSGIML
jgi:hypothetical protein